MNDRDQRVFRASLRACRLKAEELEQAIHAACCFLSEEWEPPRSAIFSNLGFTELRDAITLAKVTRNLPQFDRALVLLQTADRFLTFLQERNFSWAGRRESVEEAIRAAPGCVAELRAVADEVERILFGPAPDPANACSTQPEREQIDAAIVARLREAGFRNQIVVKAAKAAWGADKSVGVTPSDETLNGAERKALDRAMQASGDRPAIFQKCQSSPALLVALTDEFVAKVRSFVPSTSA